MNTRVSPFPRLGFGRYLTVASAFVLIGSALASEPAPPVPAAIQESTTDHEARMKWWREARFGIFVHWGLFSAAGCTWKGQKTQWLGCWMQSSLKIPKEEYAAALLPKFTGEHFDAGVIAQLAKDAGAKYIVPITKHHEGFALFDSKVTDFTITNTPAKRDWIRELADASRARGLNVGLYYSQNLDWHHTGKGWTPDRYFDELVMPQIGELLSGYGKVSILWFDIPAGGKYAERAQQVVAMAKRLQPEIVLNNRLGGGFRGDFQTPEQYIPPTGIPGQDWETCQTLNGTWEYTHYDRNWKSTTSLVRELIDTVSKGGNYLLNIGPKPDGTVPQSSIDTLRAIGGWMKVHGDAIYGTTASPFPHALPWGRCTQKALGDGMTRLYLHIYQWPFDSILRVPALDNDVSAAALLSEPGAGPLSYTKDANGDLLVRLPNAEPNDYATVVTLDLKGSPTASLKPISANAEGLLHLPASLALIQAAPANHNVSGLGEKAKTAYFNPATQALDAWMNPDDRVFWPITMQQSGTYAVDLCYSCMEAKGGGEYVVELGDQTISATAATTPTWKDFRTDRIGLLNIEKSDLARVIIRLTTKSGQDAMKLRSITLTPAGTLIPQTP
jgi:alpha-L-fucosidase